MIDAAPNETNPYRSPPPSDATAVSPPPTHPERAWRIVPVVLLYLYGSLAMFYSIVTLYLLLGGCGVTIDRTHRASTTQILVIMLAMVLLALHGACAIALGRYIRQQRSRRAGIAFAAAILLAALIGATQMVVHHLPPGPERRSPAANAAIPPAYQTPAALDT
jgi:hypothetical protein